MSGSSLSEYELVSLLRLHDEKAFCHLYDNYSGALYKMINRLLQNTDTSKDVLQLAFLRIWKTFSAYDPDKSTIFTWIMAIARNAAIDMLREQARDQGKKILKHDFEYDEILLPDNIVYTPIDAIGIESYILKLHPKHRIIIELIYFSGYSLQQVSSMLNIPLGTVKTRKRDAMAELQAALTENRLTACATV